MAYSYLGGFRQGLGSYLSDVGLLLTTTSATTGGARLFQERQQPSYWLGFMNYFPQFKTFDEPKNTILEKLRAETKEFIGNRM